MTKTISISNHAFCGNEEVFRNLLELNELLPQTETETINIDFTGLVETNPFNMLLIARKVYQVRHNFPNNGFKFFPKIDSDYLEHMGFYNAMGSNRYGRLMGEAWGNSQYMGIKEIDISMQDFYNKIENISAELSRVLKFDNDLASLIKYSFVETIRNVYEHAETTRAFVCAQKWPKHNLVEIAILDEGCGIATALGKRIGNKSELELLQMSLQPGISTRSNHFYLDRNDYWRNSGYGLYVLKELCKYYGASFYLCSNNYALIQNNTGKFDIFETNFAGTAIALRFRTDMNVNFSRIIKKIVAEGENLSNNIAGSIKHASKSSGGKYN